MPLKTDTLQRQLALATEDLQKRVKVLDEKGVDAKGRSRDSQWRSLNAKCRRIRHRIAVVGEIAERDAECERRKQESAEDSGE
ncbi:hypothetical protein GC176_21295 [bacterium]|nr:hypothetical protein [bacterium]